MYATKAELIAEGAPADISDERATRAIQLASDYIDLMTGQWFEDRAIDYMTNGTGQRMIFLPVFVRAVQSITVDSSLLDQSEYTVYNRFFPDDRRNPKIEFANPLPSGRLNVKISGTFGYVDKKVVEQATSYVTPEQIKKICLMLALGEVDTLSSDSRRDIIDRGRIKEEQTDRHSYTLSDVLGAGAYTGVPEIDQVLIAFRKPLGVGMA